MLNPLIQRHENPLMKEMRDFFQRFNRGWDLDQELSDFPKLEVKNKDKVYVIRAEVPGLTEKDISVTLRDQNLIIEGERKTETTTEDEGTTLSEFSYGNFYRSIPLEDEVNPDSVNASYKNGMLTVKLDKVRESNHRVKKIPVTLS